jgi:MFS superfamily sulfate permease-like transporter
MLIPQSVSYASSLAKLSPVAGLVRSISSLYCLALNDFQFSAAIPGIIYALLGSSRQLNVAPEASLSLLVGQAIADIVHPDTPSHLAKPNKEQIGIAVATMITLQVGL